MSESFALLVKRSRTVRRYRQEEIPKWILKEIAGTARLTPSAGNRQPTRIIIVSQENLNNEIFKNLGWLGYIAEDMGPPEGERPTAYIVMLYDNRIRNASFQYDMGIVSQTIILHANYYEIGCCIIGAVKHENIRNMFNISPYYDIMSIIALGYPLEEVKLEESKDESDVMYWRDENKIHHVPKLPYNSFVIGEYFE